MNNRPKIGIGVFVFKNGKVLMGKRKNSHGDGTWSLPGGHLEFKESFAECAARETLEEAGICIKNVKFYSITNDIFEAEGKHYVTIFLTSECNESDDAIVKEPEKMAEWKWIDFNEVHKMQPLFKPLENLLKEKKIIVG